MRIFNVISLILLLSLSGCGYSIVGSRGVTDPSKGGTDQFIDSIKIGRIENKTHEPKLDDILKKALADEIMKHGIGIDSSSAYEITGSIDRFELRGVSEKENFFSEYEVLIGGRFSLKTEEGKNIELRGEGPFSVYFHSEGDLRLITAMKEEAIKRALQDLASEITASVIYR